MAEDYKDYLKKTFSPQEAAAIEATEPATTPSEIDLTPINNLLNQTDESLREILGGLPMEARQDMLGLMKEPRFSKGQRYRFSRAAGLLPQKEATSFLTSPQQALGEVGQEAGQLAQQYQYEAYAPNKSWGQRQIAGLLSGLYETTGVGAKLAAGLTDPKTLAAFIVSKLGPPGALAAATYFGYQGVSGLADAIKTGKITPESLQNGLLGAAGIVGSVAMAGEAGTAEPMTRATITARLKPMVRQVTGITSGAREAVTRAAEKYAEEAPKTEAERAKIQQENAYTRQLSGFQDTNKQYRLAKKNAEIREENERAQQEYETQVRTRKESQIRGEGETRDAKTKVEQVENKVWQEGNRKFNNVKERVGADRPGEPTRPAEGLRNTLKEIKDKLAPDQAAIFDRMTNMVKESSEAAETREIARQRVMESLGYQGGTYEQLEPFRRADVDRMVELDMQRRLGGEGEAPTLTWSKLQRMKTATEEMMRKPTTSEVMKFALGEADKAIVEQMESMATEKGATAEWQEARDFWRKWREDFHDYRGAYGSGSPIAQAMIAVDPSNINDAFTRTYNPGTETNRAVNILRGYPQFGGNEAGEAVQTAVKTQLEIEKVPKKPKGKPVVKEPEVSRLLKQKEVPPPTEQPTVDLQRDAVKILEQRSKNWSGWTPRDVGIFSSSVILAPFIRALFKGGEGASALAPMSAVGYLGGKFLGARLIRDPRVVEWLKSAPPEEIASLRKIPGADKVNILNGITDEVVQNVMAGQRPVMISPAVRALLGPSNVAKILAASGTRERQQPGVQNRREALELLGQPPQ